MVKRILGRATPEAFTPEALTLKVLRLEILRLEILRKSCNILFNQTFLGLGLVSSLIYVFSFKEQAIAQIPQNSPKNPTKILNENLSEVSVEDLFKTIVQRNTNLNARRSQLEETRKKIFPQNFDFNFYPLPLNQELKSSDRTQISKQIENQKYWLDILWKTAVVEPQQPYIAEALAQILQFATNNGSANQISPVVITAALRLSTQLYLSKSPIYISLEKSLIEIANNSENSDWVAIALSTLAQAKPKIDSITEPNNQPGLMEGLIANSGRRFNLNNPNHLRLATTLSSLDKPLITPPLRDLLLSTVAPKQPHLYIVCASDRDRLCQAIAKDSEGNFLTEANGKLWTVPLLLQSLHRIDWNFSNGITPQGIYRMEGLEPQTLSKIKDIPTDSEFRAYGQFQLVKLFMPFESQVKQFIPGMKGAFKQDIQAYQTLLPPSWRNHFPLQQSYWAGKLGRSFIRIHGSGFAPGYFRSNSPAITLGMRTADNWNPALGCLSALELYDTEGKLIQADMPKILQGLRQVGKGKVIGYAIVVDLAPNQEPIDQINKAIIPSLQ
jgi:hypothetical protein